MRPKSCPSSEESQDGVLEDNADDSVYTSSHALQGMGFLTLEN